MHIPPALAPTCSLRSPVPFRVIKNFWGSGVVEFPPQPHSVSDLAPEGSLRPSSQSGLSGCQAARRSKRTRELFSLYQVTRTGPLRGPSHSDWRGGRGPGGEQRRQESGARFGKEGIGEPGHVPHLPLRPSPPWLPTSNPTPVFPRSHAHPSRAPPQGPAPPDAPFHGPDPLSQGPPLGGATVRSQTLTWTLEGARAALLPALWFRNRFLPGEAAR